MKDCVPEKRENPLSHYPPELKRCHSAPEERWWTSLLLWDVFRCVWVQLSKGLSKDALHYFFAEITWTKSNPPVHGKRLPTKKRGHDVMVEISALGLNIQLQHLHCVIWRKSGLPWLSFVMFNMEPTQRRLSTDNWLKPSEVLTRSWDIIKIFLNVNLALILILNKRETKADSSWDY